jgi:hypothetical protein
MSVGCGETPRLDIGKICRHCANGIWLSTLVGQLPQDRRIVVGQQQGELVTASKWEDGIERIELLSTLQISLVEPICGFELRFSHWA